MPTTTWTVLSTLFHGAHPSKSIFNQSVDPKFDFTVYRILCESLRFGQSDDIYDLSQKKEAMIQEKFNGI